MSTRSVLLIIVILSITASAATAQTPNASENYFTNTELIDQNGNKLRFYQDVLKGKVIVINTFHTDCKSTTPPMNRNLQKVQDAFATNLGKDLFLISITVDAAHDTPAMLGDYAKQWQAKPGWLFLTGSKENVSTVLKKLGQYVENKEEHASILIIGNETTGLWKKAFALAKPEELVTVVKSVLDDNLPAKPKEN